MSPNKFHTPASLVLMLALFSTSYGLSQDGLLASVFRSNSDSLFQQVVGHPDDYRIQIIYTQIDRDENNVPHCTNHYFHVDPDDYFNPASTVKLPTAIFSLEKINALNIEGLSKYSTVQYEPGESRESAVFQDSTAENGFPSLAQYIRKAFLVSENDPYNRFYQWVTPETINRKFQQLGFAHSRITSQFLGLSVEENRHTNPVRFLDTEGHILYRQDAAYNQDTFDFSQEVFIGDKHYDRQGNLLDGPIEFTRANKIALEDLQQLLQRLLFPESVTPEKRYQLNLDDYEFLYRYLSQYPSETNYPKYDADQYFDSYAKFFFRAGGTQMPPHVRVFNKVGWAYGFLTDVSYIVDFEHQTEFMLTATVYANSDGILNDGEYDYETVGWPFLYQLGQTVYRYDLSRKREYTPDLSRFIMRYTKRGEDGRPALKDVDN